MIKRGVPGYPGGPSPVAQYRYTSAEATNVVCAVEGMMLKAELHCPLTRGTAPVSVMLVGGR
jgi:hypothetical protein